VSEWRLYLFLWLFLLTGCANIPDFYAPPEQRKPLTGTEPHEVGDFVNLGDIGADTYIVRDVNEAVEGAGWRWTRKRPELRFFLDSVEKLTLKAEFAVAGATMKDTGPVNIAVLINGQLLDTVHCEKAGEHYFEKRVPAKLLQANAINLVALEIDKVWIAPDDGAVLGFILTRVGFAPE
jgi:hypothetical protein